jgi:hypothetical protein
VGVTHGENCYPQVYSVYDSEVDRGALKLTMGFELWGGTSYSSHSKLHFWYTYRFKSVSKNIYMQVKPGSNPEHYE